jgi:Tat protein translocase TatB subunit
MPLASGQDADDRDGWLGWAARNCGSDAEWDDLYEFGSLVKTSLAHYDDAMNLGMPEMIFIFLLALVVVGPRKLPELGRQLGKFLAEFKRASNEFKNQLETEMLNIELEERASKDGEDPKVLPPEQPWERLMKPLSESISRAHSELISITSPEPPRPASPVVPPIDAARPPIKPAGGE